MKRVIAVMLAGVLSLGLGAVPAAAHSGGHGGGHGGGGGGHHGGGGSHHGGHGHHGGVGIGVFPGFVWAAPYYAPPVYVPFPVYPEPPGPSCYAQPGYWTQVPLAQEGGFTTYQWQWVPDQMLCR